VAKLLAARARYGIQTAAGAGPECAMLTADGADRITLTRRELNALVDEAVQKDRARR